MLFHALENFVKFKTKKLKIMRWLRLPSNLKTSITKINKVNKLIYNCKDKNKYFCKTLKNILVLRQS